jgi:hypothetical protein
VDDACGPLAVLFAFLILAPVFWFLVPLARVLVELPLAVSRSFFSSTRWIEAVCRWPSEIVITWRTTRDEADALADEIARRLKEGYADVTPSGAELMTMTRPPGLNDFQA